MEEKKRERGVKAKASHEGRDKGEEEKNDETSDKEREGELFSLPVSESPELLLIYISERTFPNYFNRLFVYV